jgi:DNA-binding CsgD family transcriptional regulator
MAEAGDAARRSGCRLVELGYLIYEAGLRGSHGPAEVAERLRVTVEHVDAPRLVAIAQATLDVAAAPHPGERSGPDGDRLRMVRGARTAMDHAALTAREHQIAVLAADRLTDREIAEQLVLSVRTVESHLARVYRKLTVTSRRQLKAALHR